MKVLMFVVAMTVASAGQPGAGQVTGSWAAQFSGHTFIRLELKTGNGGILGAISLGSFEIDTKGVVKAATDAPRSMTPIFDVALKGSIVTFAHKDGNDTDRFVLRMLDNGGAELQVVLSEADRKELAATGTPLPKPIPLTRQ